ncbi:MAG: EamA family transporter [Clostridia bacterium]|nr:EamA family transporter [Clostridia bacterium]
MKSVLIFILSVCIASTSQILLKKSANQTKQNKWQEYFNKYVIIAYILLLISTLLTMIAYKNLNLSTGVVIESISYIIIAILSYFLFREKITKSKAIGIIMIVAGIIIASIG